MTGTEAAGQGSGSEPIDPEWARGFAVEWIDAWNAADLERVLGHYAEEFEMSSPLIRDRMGVASGRLNGKAAVRPYWARGISAQPPLHFELIDVLTGMNVIAIYYRNVTFGRTVIERLEFDQERRIVRGEAIYGSSLS
jgi:hypothetical protein